MGTDTQWALFWRSSLGPGAMRAEKLEDVLRWNSQAAISGEGETLIVCGVHESLEEALEYRRYLKGLRKERKHDQEGQDGGEVPGVRSEIQDETAQE